MKIGDGEEEKLLVRRIMAEDKEALIHLSREIYIYNNYNLDYVEKNFERWLASSNRHLLGLELNHKLIGFKSKTVIDEGQTIWEEALRIDKDYRGRGYFRAFGELERRDFPLPQSVKRIRQSKLCYSRDEVEELMKSKPKATLLAYRKSWYLRRGESLTQTIAEWMVTNHHVNSTSIHYVSADRLFELMQNHTHFDELVPNQLVISDWCGFDFTLRNLQMLEMGGFSLFVCSLISFLPSSSSSSSSSCTSSSFLIALWSSSIV